MNTARARKRLFVLFGMAVAALWAIAPAIGPGRNTGNAQAFFLNVGQGDGNALVLADGGTTAVFMIDAGPRNGMAAGAMDVVAPPFRRRVDIAFLTHPNLDHYGGIGEVVRRYDVGLIVMNGRAGRSAEWNDAVEAIRRAGIPTIALGAGDALAFGSSTMRIVSPTPEFRDGPNDNDSSLVIRADTPDISLLFTGDIGPAAERFLRNKVGRVDILKVPHHGSRFSSTAEFLRAVSPRIGVIEVGKNSYGHPTDDALRRLAGAHVNVYRTDTDGTVTVRPKNGVLHIYKTK